MPELRKDNVRNLFLYHVAKGKQFVKNEDNYIIEACLRCCSFQKSKNQGSHYLPLALKILDLYLGCLSTNPLYWMRILLQVRDFNYFFEVENPVFNVIRLNFDRLSEQRQALFIDIVLYWRKRHYLDDHIIRENYQDLLGLLEWLSLVHHQKLEDTQRHIQSFPPILRLFFEHKFCL